MSRLIRILFITGLFTSLFSACTPVKAYQKQYLNDHNMAQGGLELEKLEEEGTSFREGASGGTSGKSGGGCGCN